MSIPLTFDWATLAWLSARWRFWWRGRARARAWLLLLLGLVTGCVPAAQLEETQSAAEVEREGRRRSEAQLQRVEAENQQLRAQMREEKAAIEQREQQLSEAELDTAAQGKRREDAEGMVEQLRGELARVGNHLQTFHDEKQKAEQRAAAEAAHGQAMARLSRDIALALSDPLATGEYTLETEQGALTLRVPSDELLSETGEQKADAARVLEIVAKLMKLHQEAQLRVEDSAAPGDAVRVARLVAALGERGVGSERLVALDPAAAPATRSATPEISFGFSVP